MANNKSWWIVGGAVGCVLLIVVLVVGLGAIGFLASRGEKGGGTDDDRTELVDDGGDDIETRSWTNDRSRLSGDRLTHFVPFTFEYPADWQVLEDGTGDSPNFVKVETMTAEQITIENFAVGWYSGVSDDQIAQMVESQFAQSFPNFERLFGESHHVDGVLSPGFTFEVTADTPQGPMTFWGRTIAVPVEPTRGVILVMFASERAPGVEGAGDVGEVGNLKRILDSFDLQQ